MKDASKTYFTGVYNSPGQDRPENFEDAQVVMPEEKVSVCRDPADDKFLDCALAGGAQYVVSEDNDLLVLREHKDIRIVNSAEFLRVLEEEGRGKLIEGGL